MDSVFHHHIKQTLLQLINYRNGGDCTPTKEIRSRICKINEFEANKTILIDLRSIELESLL